LSRTAKPGTEPAPDAASPTKILIIRLRRIGDVVMTTPAVAVLRRAFPQAMITYLIEEPFRRLVEGHPDIDRVIALPERQKVGELAALVRRIRKEGFDAVLDFHGGPRASFIAFFSGAKRKIGYETKYRRFIYDVKIPRGRPEGPVHSVENHLNLVRALGVEAAEAPRLKLPKAAEEEIRRIDRIWKENHLSGSKVVAVHIGAGNRFRDWGAGNWAALTEMLGREDLVRVILVGGEDGREREKEIRAHTGEQPVPLAGRLNLAELGEVLGRVDLFIGPDSGPMHIAAAAGAPIVALFGPTLPAHFAPWRAKAVLVEKSLDCRPCRQRECAHQDFRCILGITVEDVLAAARQLLKTSS